MLFRRNKPEDVPYTVPRRKWWLPPLLGLIALCGLVFAGVKLYRRIEPSRLAAQAKVMMDKGDLRGAALTLTRALQINPASDVATRRMVELMERLQAPQVIEWRRRLAELNPGSAPEAISWAQMALRKGNAGIAQHALDSVASDQRQSATWHSTAGVTAIRAGDWKKAREHFLEATKLAPDEDMHRYNLALAQLQSPEAAERAEATATLDQLTAKGRVNVFAKRSLIAQLVRDGKVEEALARSTELLKGTKVELSDRITHLDLLRKLGRPELATALAEEQEAAFESAPESAALINWLRLNGQPAEGLAFADSPKSRVAGDPLVLAARGECLLALQRWNELRDFAVEPNWGVFNVRRLALLARAQEKTGDKNGANTSWAAAIQLAVHDRDQLVRLAAQASEWGWKLPMRDALWAATEAASPTWALKTLHGSYQEDGDTAGLLRVARRMVALDPTDRRARNNAVQCALLLGVDLETTLNQARRLAIEVPDDPIIASTYAFALLTNERPDEALNILKKLSPDQRRKPAIALTYALALRGVGENSEVGEYLDLAASAPLLPEERRLLEAARKP